MTNHVLNTVRHRFANLWGRLSLDVCYQVYPPPPKKNDHMTMAGDFNHEWRCMTPICNMIDLMKKQDQTKLQALFLKTHGWNWMLGSLDGWVIFGKASEKPNFIDNDNETSLNEPNQRNFVVTYYTYVYWYWYSYWYSCWYWYIIS